MREPRRAAHHEAEAQGERPRREHALDKLLAAIAKDKLHISTLETLSSDGLDFHDVAAGRLREALLAAYLDGADAVFEKLG